ncbi:hypothetical protein OPQ81_011754 [Rhizoctonia solani]|nr:hypothetical protein OPQ81_011754 [Rhizoctonia solani]
MDFILQPKDAEYMAEDGIMVISYEQVDYGFKLRVFMLSICAEIEALEKRVNGAGVDVYGIDTDTTATAVRITYDAATLANITVKSRPQHIFIKHDYLSPLTI